MIDSAKIKKMVADIARRERGARDRKLVHPMREWGTGLVVVMFGVVAGGGFSFFMYESTNESNLTSDSISVPGVPYQQHVVESANTKYAKLRASFDVLLGTPARPVVVSASTSTTPEVPEEPKTPEPAEATGTVTAI